MLCITCLSVQEIFEVLKTMLEPFGTSYIATMYPHLRKDYHFNSF